MIVVFFFASKSMRSQKLTFDCLTSNFLQIISRISNRTRMENILIKITYKSIAKEITNQFAKENYPKQMKKKKIA